MSRIVGLRPRLSLMVAATCVKITHATAQQPGITETTVKLGTQAPMSGPVALIGMVA